MTRQPASVTDEERIARAVLLRVTEPSTTGVVRHVRAVGPVGAVDDIRRGRPIGNADIGGLQQRALSASGEADLEVAGGLGARLVCPGEAEWPTGLDDLSALDADCFGIWIRGAASLADACHRAVAVVGTRAATDYGVHVAGDLAAGLAEREWTVVSGLAFGIDAAAHRGALAAGGLTVGVLACGVDIAYPRTHRELCDRIVAAGALVSEHPPGAAPQRTRFLVRNRLIAALTAGTVVVEAAPRSGARSTARHAADLFRHVMVVPGPVTSTLSAGCHQLLRDRPDAVLVTKADEVIEQVGALGEFAERVTGPVRRRDLLGPAVSRVLDAVPVTRSAAVASIATTAGMRVDATAAALAALAVHDLVEADDGSWRMTKLGRAERRHPRPPDAEELPLAWL